MRVVVTGGAGFVGSNVVAVAADAGHEVTATVRAAPPAPHPRCTYLREGDDVRAVRPDVVVHTAIWNDFAGIYADRRRAWEAYVGATRVLADAANDLGAALLIASSDWVFDGTQSMADETTPPNPVNYYGVLKAASELVTLERAHDPIVARLSGVIGAHRAGRELPRRQDAGFGYLVDAVVGDLSQGRPFTVWESDRINSIATPTLATLAAEWMLGLAERGARGVFHCTAGEAVTRVELARSAADAFGLDRSLVLAGAPPADQLPAGPVPYDTSLDARATAAVLGTEPPSVADLLARFRAERTDSA